MNFVQIARLKCTSDDGRKFHASPTPDCRRPPQDVRLAKTRTRVNLSTVTAFAAFRKIPEASPLHSRMVAAENYRARKQSAGSHRGRLPENVAVQRLYLGQHGSHSDPLAHPRIKVCPIGLTSATR